MQYLIRFIQVHETFRQPETNALAELAGLRLRWHSYHHDVGVFEQETPYAIVSFEENVNGTKAAQILASRSILISTIHELWGSGTTYDELHADVKSKTSHFWPQYETASFRFEVDSFQGSRTTAQKRELIEAFRFLNFKGPTVMSTPDVKFVIYEDYKLDVPLPHRLFLGRQISESGRKVINTYNLKKRKYISTTSMDAELSLITANIALAAPGKLSYDPFMGTGSFPLACACFGACVLGSDLDGRSIRGTRDRSVRTNFEQYGTTSRYMDSFTADITNTPVSSRRFLDVIICDPPYGVREGLKVLGHTKESMQSEVILSNGVPAHLQKNYVPPKRPYSFLRMLDDILDFSANRLVDEGRLAMWMPVAGVPEDVSEVASQPLEYAVPQHPCLEISSICQQDFNKWSRRLLTYRRQRDDQVDPRVLEQYRQQRSAMLTDPASALQGNASDLNDFRKQYFAGFKDG